MTDKMQFKPVEAIKSEHGTGWFVPTNRGTILCANASEAIKTAQIINWAYYCGKRDIVIAVKTILEIA
jgi:hypothetical protein